MNAPVRYHIIIKTADRHAAGIDSAVMLKMHGEKGSAKPIELGLGLRHGLSPGDTQAIPTTQRALQPLLRRGLHHPKHEQLPVREGPAQFAQDRVIFVRYQNTL